MARSAASAYSLRMSPLSAAQVYHRRSRAPRLGVSHPRKTSESWVAVSPRFYEALRLQTPVHFTTAGLASRLPLGHCCRYRASTRAIS